MLVKHLKYVGLLGVLGGLGLTACGEKKEDTNAPAGGGDESKVAVKAPAPQPEAEPAPAAGGLEDVAKAMGFAQYLPNTTHMYAGVFDGKGFVDAIRKSKLVKLLEARAAEEGAFDLDELEESPEAAMVLSLFSEEIFVGVGKGAPEQAGNLMAINEATTRHWIKFMVKMGEAQVTGKAPEGPGGLGGPEMMIPLIGGLLGDPSGGLTVLEKSQVPPVMIGFKVSDEETRGQLAGMATDGLKQMLEEIGPEGQNFAEAVSVTRGDSIFSGIKIVGKKLAGLIDDDAREEMAQVLDAASIDKLIKILEAKNIVITVGVHGNYLVGFAGSDAEELQIAASPGESILARPEMNFMKSYAGKKLLAVVTASKELQDSMAKHVTILGSLVTGLREGLSQTKGFGDTRDLEVLLDLVAEQEKALLNMNTYTPGGMVAFLEKGLKVEAYGGTSMSDVDLDTPRKYAGVGMDDDISLFANWVENPVYTEKALEYIDSIGETIYLGAKHITKMEIEGADLKEFKEGFGMFDEQIRPHLVELWTGLRGDLVTGLGAEGALIVDLKGELPTVPGLPQVVVDKGKAPRIGLLAPADDKEKLSAAWKRIDGAAQGLLKVASELTGEKIPMQKPMSSEKNDLKTWFIPFPFQTDDFVLSISVDEKNFFASTSKTFVQALSSKLEKAEVDETQKGVYFKVDLTLLRSYVNDWLKLVQENADAIFGEDSPAGEDFQKNLPLVKEVVGAWGEIKGVTAHVRKAEGTIRTSVHFETGE